MKISATFLFGAIFILIMSGCGCGNSDNYFIGMDGTNQFNAGGNTNVTVFFIEDDRVIIRIIPTQFYNILKVDSTSELNNSKSYWIKKMYEVEIIYETDFGNTYPTDTVTKIEEYGEEILELRYVDNSEMWVNLYAKTGDQISGQKYESHLGYFEDHCFDYHPFLAEMQLP